MNIRWYPLALAIAASASGCAVQDEAGVLQSELTVFEHRLRDVNSGNNGNQGVATVVAVASANPALEVDISVDLHHALANTTYVLQRAPEPNTYPLGHDGICQRADGQAPQLGPAFVPFPGVTMVSDDDGNASVSFHFATPPTAPFQDGTQFDVEFRVLDGSGTSEYRSECFTVTVL
jgi:hypothetical protein